MIKMGLKIKKGEAKKYMYRYRREKEKAKKKPDLEEGGGNSVLT